MPSPASYPPPPGYPSAAGPTGHPGAFLIDAVILLLLTIPVNGLIFVTFFGVTSLESTFFAAPFIVFPFMLFPLLIQMAYVALTEGRTGQLFGKRVVGIRVVKVDGRPIARHDAVIRWICLAVDQQPTFGILGLILFATGPLKQRAGDLAMDHSRPFVDASRTGQGRR